MAVDVAGNWQSWLRCIERELGDEYVAFAQRISGANSAREWGWYEAADWLSYAMRVWTNARTELLRGQPVVGLFVEPCRFSPRGRAIRRDESAMIELAVRLQLRRGQRVGAVLRDLRAVLEAAFGDQVATVDYPSANDRPRDRVCIHRVVRELGSEWTDERGLWISIVPNALENNLASGRIRDVIASNADAARIAADLRAQLARLIAVVEFIRGWIGPTRFAMPSRIQWIGWLGEYAARRDVARALDMQLSDLQWRGRFANADFRSESRSIEVKSSITGLPRVAYFTANELTLALAARENYGLVRVALDPRALDTFVRTVVDNEGNVGPRAPAMVLTRLSADLGLPWPWVDARARVIQQALAAFMASRPEVQGPSWNPFDGERYASLRGAIATGTLIEGWVQI